MTWSKAEIRNARKIPLAPILHQRGIQLRELPGQNYKVEIYGDLIVKDCFWIWKSRQLHGNTIDFLIMIENLSFAQAMQTLLGSSHPKTPNESRSKLPSYEMNPSHPHPQALATKIL